MQVIYVVMSDHFARASEQLPTMFSVTERLLQSGNAYLNDGWMYFDIRSDAQFAQLAFASGLMGYNQLLESANLNGNDPHDPRKRDPLDFLLWRGAVAGEPAWPSPWGPGRPGWHIECSAAATRFLGPQIDIHGGGAELIFSHHSCANGQTETATRVLPGRFGCWGIWRRPASLVSCQTMNCLLLASTFARWQSFSVCAWTKPPRSRDRLANVECFYKRIRRHSSPGSVSPIAYEQLMGESECLVVTLDRSGRIKDRRTDNEDQTTPTSMSQSGL